MTGAGHLAARGAQRAGAGYVRASSPGVEDDPGRPTEAVGTSLPAEGWAATVREDAARFGSLVVGPGLGRADAARRSVVEVVAQVERPLVVDGDGLTALAGVSAPPGGWPALRVLTPHDGEFAVLTGRPAGPDRLAEARSLAAAMGCVVLLKGPTTVVAEPGGTALLVTEGDERLATAGSGDVLSGIIGALLAQPPGGPADAVDAARLVAAGAFLHGRAARLGPRRGLVAGDLPALLSRAAASLDGRDPATAPGEATAAAP
jgi:NAD(P)H-hydrate epimerase